MQVVRADLVFFRAWGLRVPEALSPGLTGSPKSRQRVRVKRVGALGYCPVARAKSRTSGLTIVLTGPSHC